MTQPINNFTKQQIREARNNEKLQKIGIVKLAKRRYVCCTCKNLFQKSRRELLKTQACPNCMSGQSFGEERAIKVLTKYNIKFKKEMTFNGLVGIKGNKLRFDFYIQGSKGPFLLEIDGEQHEEGNQWAGNTVIHDKRKNDFCQKKQIKLYRIPYKFGQLDVLEKKIIKVLKTEFDCLEEFENAGVIKLSEDEINKLKLKHQPKYVEKAKKVPSPVHNVRQMSYVELQVNHQWLKNNNISIELRGQVIKMNKHFMVLETLTKQKVSIPTREITHSTTLKEWGI